MDLALVQRAALVLTAALAWVLAAPSRAPHHRPAALLLTSWAAADLLRWSLWDPLDAAPTPYAGAWRALFHLDEALCLLWPAGAVAFALLVLADRSPGPAVGAWIAAVIILAAGYPELRLTSLDRVRTALHVARLVVELASFVAFLRRGAWPGAPQEAAIAILAGDVGLTCGPYLFAAPARDWFTSRWPAILVYGVMTILQMRRILWIKRASRSSATRARAFS